MGRCSATEVFDPVTGFILAYDLPDAVKLDLIKKLVDTLENYDWDCQSDSDYYEHPLVRQAMRELHPDDDWDDDPA